MYLYVAPLKDLMLLGMDFMRDSTAKLNLKDETLSLEGERIVMSCDLSPSYREVHETYLRGVCLAWHPSNLPDGGRFWCLRTQDSWIVSTIDAWKLDQ